MSIDSTANDAARASLHSEDANVLPAPTTITGRLLMMVGRDKAVLEMGGEVESLSQLLAARGCRVVSVQPHAEGRNRAQPNCERVIVGDVELLDLERETGGAQFDVVLVADLLTRVKDPGALLMNIARLLHPFGCVVAAVPNVAHLSVRLSMLAGRSPYDSGVTNSSHLRFYTRDVLVSLFDEAGFGIVRLDRQQDAVASAGPDLGGFVMPDLVEALRNDPDSRTSHFLVAAHHLPSPAGGALRVALNELREHREELQAEATRAARTIDELRIEVQGYQREIEQHQDTVRALNAQSRRRDEIVESLSLQLDQHRAEFSRMTGVLEQNRGELGAVTAELDRHRVEVATATDQLQRERFESARARAEAEVLKAELERGRAESEMLKTELERGRAEAEVLKTELVESAMLETQLEMLKTELEQGRAESKNIIAGQQQSLLAEREAVASARARACRVAAEAAALRDSRVMRVARWLRGDLDLWERVPAESAVLKRDAIQYGFRRNGYALRESVNLQRASIVYPLPVRLNSARGVALQVAVAVQGCGGVIGVELISPSNEVVTRGTLSLDLVSDQLPTVIQFKPTDIGGDGWGLRVFITDSPSPVRILEFQRYIVPIQRALFRRPFCSIVG
ncbi:MAG: hypothetical protein C5B57_03445 [Blastocatellia bacterium]|nr:MAG: hypothetical protein C5B57_03445 [Blastocatellia bacterium]